MAEDSFTGDKTMSQTQGRFSPLFVFKLVGRGIRGLVRNGMKIRGRKGSPGTPVASMSGAFLPAPSYHHEEFDINRLLTTAATNYKPIQASKHPFFPVLFDAPGRSFLQQPQRLLTVGTRQWGALGGGLLNVRLYDYALYVDSHQVKEQLSPCLRGSGACPTRSQEPTQQLNASNVDMAVTIRAARNLPVSVIGKEYESVLRRRLAAVGANPDDPALFKLLSFIREEKLPRHVLDGKAIRRGSSLSFVRGPFGKLTTMAEGEVLGSLTSPDLCKALFDLYLGKQPVCDKSKAAAADSLKRMSRDPTELYRLSKQSGERLLCQRPELEACVVQLN